VNEEALAHWGAVAPKTNNVKSSEVAKVTDPCHTLTAALRGHYCFVGEGHVEGNILNTLTGEAFFSQ
jgi:hypothetical protein